jgi:hypothetical protein
MKKKSVKTASVARCDIFVSPRGDDANDGSADKPFRTVRRAQLAAREASRGNVTVHLSPGRHVLDAPLVFGPEDGRDEGQTVTYTGQADAPAILDGGLEIGGWARIQDDPYGRWAAPASLTLARQFFVNGRRALRTFMRGYEILPLELMANGSGYRTVAKAAANLIGSKDVEFIYRMMWTHVRCRVDSVRDCGSHYEILMQQPEFQLARSKGGVQIGEPWMIEGAPGIFGGEGLWNFDAAAGQMVFKPWAHLDMEGVHTVVPRLQTLLEIRGTPDHPVRNVRFEHIGFEHATWNEPSRTGFVEVQANFRLTKEIPLVPIPNHRSSNGALLFQPRFHEYARTPGAVLCEGGEGIVFKHCHFARLGGCGLDIQRASSSVRISDCEFYEISGNAVQIGDVLPDDHHPSDPRLGVRDVDIDGCHIHHIATEFFGGVGIFVGYACNVSITGNTLHHLPYTGVSLGWGWGAADLPQDGSAEVCGYGLRGPALAGGHIVEGNIIRDAMQKLEDGAAIYTLGRLPGTRITNNHIRDCIGYPGGIYLDQGTADVVVEGNDIARVPKAINRNNWNQGRDRSCLIRNNKCDCPDTDALPGDQH